MSKGSRVDRRTVIKSTGAAGIFGLAGCLGGNGDGNGNGNGTRGDSDGPTEVRFVLNPAESDVDIEAQYQPMFEYLESEVDVAIEPVPTSSYAATLQEIRRDGGEVADTSPSAAVAGEEVADVIGIRIAYGAARYFSLITTTPDENGVDSLQGLEGENIAMASSLSVSGTLAPMVMLKDAGLDVGNAPDGDAVDFNPQYSDHSTAREQLIENPSVAAATTGAFSTAPHVPQEQFDEMSQDFVEISAEYENAGSATDEAELQLLAVSDPLPRAPLMSRSNWDDPVREDIEAAILEATEEDLAHDDDYDGEPLWFTGVQEASHEDFEPIAAIMDELGLEFGDIS
ncbi:PhnD/SsuA/transferrin family substrate-binding protein [Natronomonas salina]|uniref:PhnD/SsuA/transferrin family substrate-binding protein n=1 Tax=Natronomonas salina TaxID=1710540 RepID=UPI0015B4B1E7|nr:PhnD/SsuA/transferrin family substrate-binding protein [Natronomonas salina]QLD88965.1 PhnD/SsuA/transferrin family substrate-binding protein [Natronomonas salina]